MNTKQCSQCSVVLSLDMFSRQIHGKYGVKSWCKGCSNKRSKQYAKQNSEKINEYNKIWIANNWDRYQDRKFQYRYGISFEQYQNILRQQNNVCAICEQPESRMTPNGKQLWLSVDHDHSCCKGTKSCGKCVRGLLCWRCNTAMGKFNDDINLIEKTITYLKKRKTK